LGLHGVILPLGSLDVLAGALQRPAPMVVQSLPLSLGGLDGAQAEVQPGPLPRAGDLAPDQFIQRPRRDATPRLIHCPAQKLAAVVAGLLVGLVSGRHVTAASTADDQAGQQRLAAPWHAPRAVERSILLEALKIRDITIP